MTDMPRDLYMIPHRTCGYIGSPHSIEESDTHYIRASELAKAYEAIVELADAAAKYHATHRPRDCPEADALHEYEQVLRKHDLVIKTAREQGG